MTQSQLLIGWVPTPPRPATADRWHPPGAGFPLLAKGPLPSATPYVCTP
ncbi:hypothetical protein ACIHAA_27360 [Streptomyces sp. NPDC052040]